MFSSQNLSRFSEGFSRNFHGLDCYNELQIPSQPWAFHIWLNFQFPVPSIIVNYFVVAVTCGETFHRFPKRFSLTLCGFRELELFQALHHVWWVEFRFPIAQTIVFFTSANLITRLMPTSILQAFVSLCSSFERTKLIAGSFTSSKKIYCLLFVADYKAAKSWTGARL